MTILYVLPNYKVAHDFLYSEECDLYFKRGSKVIVDNNSSVASGVDDDLDEVKLKAIAPLDYSGICGWRFNEIVINDLGIGSCDNTRDEVVKFITENIINTMLDNCSIEIDAKSLIYLSGVKDE